MKIIKAKTAGFCFGVANAVEKSFDILRNKQENAVVFSYGELIHNDHVIHRLTELGMRVIHDVDEIIAPNPGPTSITLSSGLMSAMRIIESRKLSSIRKF